MAVASPDRHAEGLLAEAPGAFRYDGHTDDPYEVAGMLAELAPVGGRILDVGCGTGSVSIIVRDKSKSEILGVEPDSARAERARSRGLNVICGFFTPGLVPEIGQFDAVMFADVLEHLAQPTELLNLARSVLKPGGVVLISVPNVAHWTVRVDILRGRWRYADCGIMDATHLRWFNAQTVEELCASCGFKVVQHRYTAGVTLPDYSWRRIWRTLGPKFRRPIIRRLSRSLPKLFGCQHVLRAEMVA